MFGDSWEVSGNRCGHLISGLLGLITAYWDECDKLRIIVMSY